MKNKPDPIYEEMNKAQRHGDEDYAKSLRPVQRALVWLIDRDDEAKGPQLWAMPYGFDKDIMAVAYDNRSKEVLEIDHPEKGYDIDFVREGTKKKTKYIGVKVARRATPVSDNSKRQRAWLKFISNNPLTDVLNFYSYEHIKGVFAGTKSRKRDEDDEEESDMKKGKKRRHDEEDDDDNTKKKGKRKREEIDDEDEDLDDDEDEEDEELERFKDKEEDDNGKGNESTVSSSASAQSIGLHGLSSS